MKTLIPLHPEVHPCSKKANCLINDLVEEDRSKRIQQAYCRYANPWGARISHDSGSAFSKVYVYCHVDMFGNRAWMSCDEGVSHSSISGGLAETETLSDDDSLTDDHDTRMWPYLRSLPTLSLAWPIRPLLSADP
jgi:hypothetical protein